eukprot:768380-Hanusia_phi.AAC.4
MFLSRGTVVSRQHRLNSTHVPLMYDKTALMMPRREVCTKDADIQLLNGNLEFQPRRVSLTPEMIAIAWENGDQIVDYIPLHEIVSVQRASIEDWAKPEEKAEVEYFDTNARVLKRQSKLVVESGRPLREFKVSTTKDGYNSGHTYIFQTHSESECQDWISTITELAEVALNKWKKKHRIQRLQARLSLFYNSKRMQVVVAVLIALNFASTATLLQMRPELNEEPYDPQVLQWLEQIDQIFTILFTIELLLNIAAHWFKAFVSNGWNLFDALIISISLVSLGPIQLPFFKAFRIMRAFRILRLFGKLQSLRLLTNALTASLVPVANAMLVKICVGTFEN